jgi:predicted  nucleic acid-binding Zn-ribbon protein
MASPMYRYQMPTEKLKDQIQEMMAEIDELEKLIEERDRKIAELEQRDAILTALENGGVDNWEWYDESLKEMN